jgi:hypothetical protein
MYRKRPLYAKNNAKKPLITGNVGQNPVLLRTALRAGLLIKVFFSHLTPSKFNFVCNETISPDVLFLQKQASAIPYKSLRQSKHTINQSYHSNDVWEGVCSILVTFAP